MENEKKLNEKGPYGLATILVLHPERAAEIWETNPNLFNIGFSLGEMETFGEIEIYDEEGNLIKVEHVDKNSIDAAIELLDKRAHELGFESYMEYPMLDSLEEKESELSALEAEEKTISEAEALIEKQTAKEGQDIGE